MPLTTLPQKVKAILPSRLAQKWLDAFNDALEAGDPDTYSHAWAVVLSEDDTTASGPFDRIREDEFSFAIDLASYKFDEENTAWVQAMPVGSWNHPTYGKLDIDLSRVSEFASNVNNGVRGQDLDIDYDHKEHSGEAAGWVKKAEARSDGLWLAVQFTQSAYQKVKEKAYRYFSPEFADRWKHPSNGNVYQNVVFGGALTNRPFLKGILPINLSEVIPNESGNIPEEYSVDIAKLRKALGLADSASEDEVLAAIDAIRASDTPPPGGDDGDETETPEEETETEPEGNLVSASELKIIKDELKSLREQNEHLVIANRLSEVNAKVSSVQQKQKGRKYTIAPATTKKLSTLALDAPNAKYSDELFGFVDDLLNDGLVELGERGGRRDTSSDNVADQFMDKVKHFQDDTKCSMTEAVNHIAMTEPELYDEYRNASYVRTRGEDS